MTRTERPLATVPRWILALLCAALLAQLLWRSSQDPGGRGAEDLPPAPSARALNLASLGEPAALARLAMVWLLVFDARGGNSMPYQHLDYERLIGWLSAILAIDPRSELPLFAASRVYAENPDPGRMRAMLEFIHREFAADPNRRWPALAQATLLAKHRLHDLPLARRYASDLQHRVTDPSVPLWARQMQAFILEDMNELEAAKIVLGGLLATGHIQDPGERRFLEARLQEVRRRLEGSATHSKR